MCSSDLEDDIAATVEHVKVANPDIFFTTVSYPIKGTPYFDKLGDRLRVVADWADRTDRDFRIAGRHSRAYYAHADAWLHADVAAHRLAPTDPVGAAKLRGDALAAREALRAVAHEVEA